EIRYHDNAMWYTVINAGQLRRISLASRGPLGGDWDGNGADSIGLYFDVNGTFALKNTNAAGAADFVFGYGLPTRTGSPSRATGTATTSTRSTSTTRPPESSS